MFLFIYGIAELVAQIRAGTIVRFLKASVLIVLLGLVGVASNTSRLWTTFEYTKESTRAGNSDLSLNEENKSSGLDKDYAMRWSQGILETVTYIIPNFMGGASQQELGPNSNLAKTRINRNALKAAPTYWGNQPMTAGPLYQGAVICFLFILGLFLVRSHLKWWLAISTLLFIMLSFGKNLPWFSDFFFYNIPMYNKFRAPTMIVLFLQISLPLLGVLGIHELISNKGNKKDLLRKFYIATGIAGGIVILFGLLEVTPTDLPVQ